MRTIVIDTETTGVPDDHLHPSDPRQPRIVQFAAVLLDADRREMASASLLVNPGVEIPAGATKVHGIDNDTAARFGVHERAAVGLFIRLCAVADVVVGHNVAFDLKMLDMAAQRAKAPTKLPSIVRCTCEASTPICALPPTQRMIDAGFNKYKSAKLEEAYRIVCGKDMAGAHNAMTDVRACIELYYALVDRGAWRREVAA